MSSEWHIKRENLLARVPLRFFEDSIVKQPVWRDGRGAIAPAPVVKMNLGDKKSVSITRRQVLLGSLMAGLSPVLATPARAELSQQSSFGGSSRAFPLHAVAFTGDYNDLIGAPSSDDIGNFFADSVTPGEAGPEDNVTLTQTAKGKEKVVTPFKGAISIPYFRVNEKGLIQEYGARTLTFA